MTALYLADDRTALLLDGEDPVIDRTMTGLPAAVRPPAMTTRDLARVRYLRIVVHGRPSRALFLLASWGMA